MSILRLIAPMGSLGLHSQIRQFSNTSRILSLSEFFDNNKGWVWNDKELLTGRAWVAAELRVKSFDDLHKLWWTCLKECNKLESHKQEARRFKLFFAHKVRFRQVKLTMARIKLVLWERRIAYLQAQEIFRREEQKTEMIKNFKGKELAEKLKLLEEKQIKMIGRKPKRIVLKSYGKRKAKDKRATSWTIV